MGFTYILLVHKNLAETNCIISASRRDMLGAVIYIVGKDIETGELVENANSCSMCKRIIINSGIEKVIVRDTLTDYRIIMVNDWILSDDSLTEDMTY